MGSEGGGREGCREVGTGGAMDGGRETEGGRREIDRYLVREGGRRERRSDGGREERREAGKQEERRRACREAGWIETGAGR